MKKRLTVFGIGLLLILLTSIPHGVAEVEDADAETKLFAFGFIRINSFTFEINGFVFVGMNGDELLMLEPIHIEYDGSPVQVISPVPSFFIINYNPAEV